MPPSLYLFHLKRGRQEVVKVKKSNLKESFAAQKAGEQEVISVSAPQIHKPILAIPLSTLTLTTDSDSNKFYFTFLQMR